MSSYLSESFNIFGHNTRQNKEITAPSITRLQYIHNFYAFVVFIIKKEKYIKQNFDGLHENQQSVIAQSLCQSWVRVFEKLGYDSFKSTISSVSSETVISDESNETIKDIKCI